MSSSGREHLIFHFSLPHSPLHTTMLSSSSSAMIGPIITFNQSEGMWVPVVPNVELKQGAFCIVNPNFWGAGD